MNRPCNTIPRLSSFTRVIDRSRYSLNRPVGFELKSGATVETSATYTYDTVGRLSTVRSGDIPVPGFTYDPDGSATAYPVPADPTANSTLTWDTENHLTSATATTYSYDAQFRHIATKKGGSTVMAIYYVWKPPPPRQPHLDFKQALDLSGRMP